ncbi:hypothetical protein CLR69_21235 [Pectobacterium zantedeschiae]|uniref:Uncharacterized protein n=1 Tax=Pectobacterium zantedeschiae TaxID=2034769 RepID=A0A9X8JGS7_9GAMM|nr:hypothetical protein CLR69_21235 [Pectobacterium zantedeschiae]
MNEYVSCVSTFAALCCMFRNARPRAAQSPSPWEPWLSAGNYAADAVPSSISGFNGPLATRSRRGASFRRVHAAHPKPAISSA